MDLTTISSEFLGVGRRVLAGGDLGYISLWPSEKRKKMLCNYLLINYFCTLTNVLQDVFPN